MWSALDDYEVRHLPHHLAQLGRGASLEQLLTDLRYLEEHTRRNSPAALMGTVAAALGTSELDEASRVAVTPVLTVLENELGSLQDWDGRRTTVSFPNQLLNGAHRLGRPDLFPACAEPPAHEEHSGWLLRSWALGGPDNWLRQRLLMPGDRASFGWDVYDAGPMGCHTEVWIDLVRSRLLSETVSTYSYGFSTTDSTFEWREWDLETGSLLRSYAPVKQSSNGEPISKPPQFQNLRSRPTHAGAQRDPDIADAVLRLLPGAEVGLSMVASVNSPEVIFEMRRPGETRSTVERFYVFNRETNQLFATPVRWERFGLRLITAARLREGLVAFGADREEHVYRLRLLSDQSEGQLEPDDGAAAEIVSFCPFSPGSRLACLRPDRVEVRELAQGTLERSDARDELVPRFVVADPPFTPKYPAKFPVQVFFRPDDRWLLVEGSNSLARPRLEERHPEVLIEGGVFATDTGAHRITLEPAQCSIQEQRGEPLVLSPAGTHAFQLLRFGIGVWETHSGKWVTELKANLNNYGGVGQARALAITPDSQQVVGAFPHELVVWNVPSGDRWELNGLRGLNNIVDLAFLWGGWRLAVLTEDHRLCICRFWRQSEVLACIRVPQGVTELRASPYGDTVFTLTRGGQLTAYRFRFRFREAGDVTSVDGNRLTVRYAAPGASSIALAGSFNDWNPAANPLQTADGVVWRTMVELPAGRHEYKLLVNGERWELDPHQPFEPGPLGPNSTITTPGATQRWKP